MDFFIGNFGFGYQAIDLLLHSRKVGQELLKSFISRKAINLFCQISIHAHIVRFPLIGQSQVLNACVIWRKYNPISHA